MEIVELADKAHPYYVACQVPPLSSARSLPLSLSLSLSLSPSLSRSRAPFLSLSLSPSLPPSPTPPLVELADKAHPYYVACQVTTLSPPCTRNPKTLNPGPETRYSIR